MSRIGLATVFHETNTYSPRRADLSSFRAFELERGNALLSHHKGKRTVLGGALASLKGEVVPLLGAGAWPSGPASQDCAEEILQLFDDTLQHAGTLDAVLFDLHGAMVADGHPDMEADLLKALRQHHKSIPIVCVLDLHGNPSVAFTRLCDAVVSYRTYPHIDMWERGAQAAVIVRRLVGADRPTNFVAKIPILSPPVTQATDAEPMRSLLQLARAAENAHPEIICVSLFPGFPYADVDRAGFTVVVTTNANQPANATRVLHELARAVEDHADAFHVSRPSPAEAVAQAIRTTEKPVVLADIADNVGGGGPGDGTAILSELLAQKASNAVVLLADREVARLCAAAGVGATIAATVGGKSDTRHGAPVMVEGIVRAVSDGIYTSRGTWMTGRDFSMGTTCVLECGGVKLVVMENATPPFHREQLECVGIDASNAGVIAVKGAIAWRSAYGDVARTVVEVDGPGCSPVDPRTLPRRTLPVEYLDAFPEG